MSKFNVGDRVKAVNVCNSPGHTYSGLIGTVVEDYDAGLYDYYFKPDNGFDKLAVYEAELERLDPNPYLVTVDANGEAELPNWVKPGYYKRTDNFDGSILLEPLMTRAEWEKLAQA